MTDFGALTLERRDEVALITLTAGDNRFNPTSIAAWNAALDEVEADESVAALVTTGTDKFYSNGLDLDWMGTLAPDERAQSGQMITDTIRLLGHGKFHRLRVGIGHPGHKDRVVGWVLGRPSKDDDVLIARAIDDAIDVLPLAVQGDFSEAMKRLHTPK